MILKIKYLLDFIFISMLCFNSFVTQVDDTLKVVVKDTDSYSCVPRLAAIGWISEFSL